MNKRKQGNYWETYATNYLIKKGYKVLFQNWTCRWGEIDIIAQKSQKLIFIEVKYKSSEKFGTPFEAITFRKMQNQLKAIKIFLSQQNLQKTKEPPWQLDIIGVTKKDQKINLQHFEAVPFS